MPSRRSSLKRFGAFMAVPIAFWLGTRYRSTNQSVWWKRPLCMFGCCRFCRHLTLFGLVEKIPDPFERGVLGQRETVTCPTCNDAEICATCDGVGVVWADEVPA